MDTLLRDVRYGVRMLLAKPGFTLAVVAVLALGIGANTAVFSLVNAFLLKPLPVENPDQLAGCFSRDVRKPEFRSFSYPNYVDLRDNNAAFSSLLAHNLVLAGLTEGEKTRRVFANIVSANYFETLGVRLFRGRPFSLAEERPESAIPVTIVSYSLWKKLGQDPDLVGKTLRINGRVCTVVGITPEGFTGTTALLGPGLYVPLGMYGAAMNDYIAENRTLARRDSHTLLLIGRLRPGLTQAQADERLSVAAARLADAYPAENKDQTFIARPLSRFSTSTSPQSDSELMVPAMLLFSLAAVILLIASLNVANMMLVRGTARGKEIAIRLALGGGARRVLRQLFTEGLLMALLGGAAGLLVAYRSTTILVNSLGRLVPLDMVYSGGLDWRVLAATLAFCVLSTVVFALYPAWSLTRHSIVGALKDGQQLELNRGKPRRLFARRNLLAMAQISLSLVLLTSAGLLIRNAVRTAGLDTGFRIDGGLLAETDASMAGYDEARGQHLYRAMLDRLRAVPGIEAAALAATVPFGMVSNGRTIQRASDPPASKADLVGCLFNIVSDGYFQSLSIPIMRGRGFVAVETAPVAILDQAAAARLWPKGVAVGQRIRLIPGTDEAEVVGVVGNIREDANRDPRPHVFLPFGRSYQANMNVHLKAALSGSAAEARLLDAVRREIRATDANLPLLTLKTLRSHFEGSGDLWVARTGARMFSVFGGVALLLATIGLYSVRAYTVALRTREIGVRMALGAGARDALGMVLREGLAVTAVAIGVGFVLSVGAAKVLSSIVYDARVVDPLVLTVCPALLAAVSMVACFVPARRAARIEPMAALRHE